MTFIYPFSRTTTPEDTGSTTKEEVFIDLKQLLFPEIFLIENVCAENFGCNTTSKILESFTSMTPFNSGVIL